HGKTRISHPFDMQQIHRYLNISVISRHHDFLVLDDLSCFIIGQFFQITFDDTDIFTENRSSGAEIQFYLIIDKFIRRFFDNNMFHINFITDDITVFSRALTRSGWTGMTTNSESGCFVFTCSVLRTPRANSTTCRTASMSCSSCVSTASSVTFGKEARWTLSPVKLK